MAVGLLPYIILAFTSRRLPAHTALQTLFVYDVLLLPRKPASRCQMVDGITKSAVIRILAAAETNTPSKIGSPA